MQLLEGQLLQEMEEQEVPVPLLLLRALPRTHTPLEHTEQSRSTGLWRSPDGTLMAGPTAHGRLMKEL